MAVKKVSIKALKRLTGGKLSTVQQARTSKNGLRSLRRKGTSASKPGLLDKQRAAIRKGSPRVRPSGLSNAIGPRAANTIRSRNEKLLSARGARGALRFTRRVTAGGGSASRQG